MSRIITAALTALVVVCAASANGSAQSATRAVRGDQTSDLMTPGARVRVKLPGEHAWMGTLVSVAGDTLLVRGASAAETTLVRFSQVTQLDVSAGLRRSRHLVRNTVIWTAAGAFVGWQIGRGMTSGGCRLGDPCSAQLVCVLGCYSVDMTPAPPIRDHAAAGTVTGGLAVGAVALLLSSHRSEDWRRVSDAPRRTSVTLSPSGGRVTVAF